MLMKSCTNKGCLRKVAHQNYFLISSRPNCWKSGFIRWGCFCFIFFSFFVKSTGDKWRLKHSKEICAFQKERVLFKRNMFFSKETCIYQKWKEWMDFINYFCNFWFFSLKMLTIKVRKRFWKISDFHTFQTS